MDGFHAVHKRYLSTCLKMRSTPEKDKIDIKSMRVDAMTKKGEVSFARECKPLLDLGDEIGTCKTRVISTLKAQILLVNIKKKKYFSTV